MPSATSSPTVWMFQYQIDIYDLLGEIGAGRRTELWRAGQHRQRLRKAERVYYMRADGGRGSAHAAIVAVGSTRSRVLPYECPDCYPWVVDVQFEALVEPPLNRDEMRTDPILGAYRGHGYLPYVVGQQSTQFPLPPEIAARTDELVRGRLKPLSRPAVSVDPIPQSPQKQVGTEYRPANEEFSAVLHDAVRIDPDKLMRGNRIHARLQNTLERYVRAASLVPRSPEVREPNFDIAWVQADTVFVAEVKSLTRENEEMQLRLGLAQILMYRHRLTKTHRDVRAILFVEREPTYAGWAELCAELGVILAWPSVVSDVLPITQRVRSR